MTRQGALFVAALLFACSNRHVDPPPPAASAGLPAAPPDALGARAASQIKTTPVTRSPRLPGEPGSDGPGAPSAPPAAPDQQSADSGVPL